jgi:hypothetical protein
MNNARNLLISGEIRSSPLVLLSRNHCCYWLDSHASRGSNRMLQLVSDEIMVELQGGGSLKSFKRPESAN